MKESKKFPIIKNFLINGKNSRIIVNYNCILIEPDDSQCYHQIISIKSVLSFRSCYCQNTKKTICECITNTETSIHNNSNSFLQSNSPSSNIKLIRIYHAIPSGRYSWKLNCYCLCPIDSNDNQLNEWINSVNQILKEIKRPKKLFVFINPVGGRKKGPKIFEQKVLPIFQAAQCTVENILTEKANHALDTILDSSFSLLKYDGIICVGGDGMFSEILNGTLIRTQVDSNIFYHSVKSNLKIPSITIGVIPAGSTDAVAFGIYGVNDPVTAALHIVLGNKLHIDVNAVHSGKDKKLLRYATSFIGYGYFGDVIADSQKHRWLGLRRYDWSGLKKLLAHRTYYGDLKIQVSTSDGSPRDTNICTSNCALCAKSGLKSKFGDLFGQSNEEVEEKDKKKDEKKELYSNSTQVTVTGKFVAVNAAIMSCRCEKSKKGMSPSAHLGNGCADLILVSRCSRINYLRFMLRIAFFEKSPFDLDFVKVYRVKEFEFSPFFKVNNLPKSYKSSVWNCDGELVPEPSVHVKIHCQLLSVFGSGLENRNMNVK